MVTIREKPVVKMRAEGICTSHSRTDVRVRDIATVVDEPLERGGSNAAPSPTEMLMASLLGCTNVILHKVAAKNGVEIEALSLKLETEFDRNGVMLAKFVEIPFPAMTLTVDVTTRASDAEVAVLARELDAFCPVSQVIRKSGTRLKTIFNVTRP